MLYESVKYQNPGSGDSSVIIDGEPAEESQINISSVLYGNSDIFKYGSNPIVFNNHLYYFYQYTMYVLSGSSFVSVSTLPSNKVSRKVIVYGGAIHFIGLGTNGTDGLLHYSWDGTNWTQHNALPFTVANTIVYNNELHIFGFANTHYKWDATNDAWSEVSSVPSALKLNYSSSVVLNNELHLISGLANNIYTTYKDYKWNGSTWTEVSTLPTMFHLGVAMIVNGYLYIFGRGIYNTYKWSGSNWLIAESDYSFIGNTMGGVLFSDNVWLFSNRWPYCEIQSKPIKNVVIT